MGKVQGHPSDFSNSGTPWIVTPVNRNPSEVCMVRAVPTACRGATSVTRALNWAESATTKNPQIQATAATTQGLCPKKKPMVSEQVPLAAIARSEEHTSELQSQSNLVCRLLLEKKKDEKARPERARRKGSCR